MKRLVLLALAVAAAVIASKLLLEDLLGVSVEPHVAGWMSGTGTGAAAVIVLLLAADIVMPVPSSLIMVLSGALFGVGWGSALALIGSIAGEWLGFELVRRYGRPMASRLVPDEERRRVEAFFARHGAAAVVVTRPMPIVMETVSVVAGLSAMTRTTFLAASLVGTAPIVVVYAWAGAASKDAGSLVPAAVILTSVAAAAWLWYRTRIATAAR